MKSIKKLMKDNKLSKDELFKIFHECIKYYLSEDELNEFILKFYGKKEDKINKRLQV